MKKTKSILVPVLSAATIALANTAKENADIQYRNFPNIVRDIQYKTVAGFEDAEQLSMDLILPTRCDYPCGAPVVIYIHGGGWSGGERYVLNPTTFESFTERGIAVACISYRLAKNGVSVLDCLIDCKDAARFLAKQAKNYNLDPTRFATIGHSAGGHLTLCTALIPNQEALLAGDSSLTEQNPVFLCAVAQAPLVTLLHPEQADSEQTITMNPTAYERFLGGTSSVASTTAQLASNSGREQYISSFQTQIPAIDLAQFLSPECWITRSSPPILLIHGSTDTLISVRGSRYFKQIADERNTRVTYIEVENAWHDFNSQDPEKTPSHTRQELDQISLDFLIQNLLKDIQTK